MVKEPHMRAGFAQRDITPPVGVEMEGFNRPDPARSVHDPLKVRALALRQEEREAAIVAVDLLFYERGAMDRLKGHIARRLGLLPQQVLVNFSHNHSGPRVSRWHYSGAPSEHYLRLVETRLIEAIREARQEIRPVCLEATMGRSRLPLSRRRINEEGEATWGPAPSQPVCRALPLCVFRDAPDSVLACVFSISCHPTINHAPVLSAEYPGVAVRRLNEHFGTDGCLFLQGAGGDAKPLNIADGEIWQDDAGFDAVEDAGRIVAEDVIAAAGRLQAVEPDLRYDLTEARFALKPAPKPSTFRVIRDHPEISEHRKRWAAEMLQIIEIHGTPPTHVPLLVHGMVLGKNVRMIGVEAELGSELGEQLISACGEGVTFPLGYTNGSRINLPCDRQLPQGGYGVDTSWEYHWPSRLAPGVDEALEKAVRRIDGPSGRPVD